MEYGTNLEPYFCASVALMIQKWKKLQNLWNNSTAWFHLEQFSESALILVLLMVFIYLIHQTLKKLFADVPLINRIRHLK